MSQHLFKMQESKSFLIRDLLGDVLTNKNDGKQLFFTYFRMKLSL